MRVYFCHYGHVTSMSKQDAIKLCQDALSGNGYNLDKYKSSKGLSRFRYPNKGLDRNSGFYQNNKYIYVNHCLDWSVEEWKELLDTLN